MINHISDVYFSETPLNSYLLLLQASIMSEIAVRDNNVPDSQRINGGFSNGKAVKAQVEGVNENTEEMQRKGMAAVVGTSAKIDETENSEAVITSIEVEYIESEDLKDVEDVDDCLKVMVFSTTLYGQCQNCVSVEVKYRDVFISRCHF